MQPRLDDNRNVKVFCDRCEAVTTFEAGTGGSKFGVYDHPRPGGGKVFYRLYRCAGCSRGGLGEFERGGDGEERHAQLVRFYPTSFARPALPPDTPMGVAREMNEAAICADAAAFRGATALLRSALEKTLLDNGYKNGQLKTKINNAAQDGAITESRKQRAHDNVRDLGNDIVHEEWRAVTAEEFSSAYQYTQRVIEDFYENRAEVVAVLKKKRRLPADPKPESRKGDEVEGGDEPSPTDDQ